jgi:pimeloyl-ACP methyl ester carboxylesterase
MTSIRHKCLFIFSILFLFANAVHAQLIPVEQNEKSFIVSSAPTMTFLYPAKEAKATLIFLPGGLGHVGVKAETPETSPFFTKYHFNLMLKRLSSSQDTDGLFNVVIFDNPTPLPQATKYSYPSSRGSSDHLVRIDSVVHHYKALLNKPIWLFGHSNGAVSMTEYFKKIQKSSQESAIAGMIYSGSLHGADFGGHVSAPVLFLHHEKDGCDVSTHKQSMQVFQKLKSQGSQKVEFQFVTGGEAQAKDPCLSGHHMYFGAEKEAAELVNQFAKKHLE